MDQIQIPRILISGVRPQCGKTLFTIALAIEFARQGIAVACAVRGLSFSAAALLRRITGRPVPILDPALLSIDEMKESIALSLAGSEVLLIDGTGGLYDGPNGFAGSDGDFASLTNTPVILCVDAHTSQASVACSVKGFSGIYKDVDLTGVVTTIVSSGNSRDVSSERLGELRDSFEEIFASCGVTIPYLGLTPELSEAADLPLSVLKQRGEPLLVGRHLLQQLGQGIAYGVTHERIKDATFAAPVMSLTYGIPDRQPRRTRIAVTDDSCFALGFQDNIQFLRHCGAETISCSPLADIALPRNIGALYLTGAYLHEYRNDLAANDSFRAAIREFHEKGGVIFAEGGGAAYLFTEFSTEADGDVFPGVGIFSGRAVLRSDLGVQYEEVVVVSDTPLGVPGTVARGVRLGSWVVEGEIDAVMALRFSTKDGQITYDGFSDRGQVCASFPFLHFASNPECAAALVEAAEVHYPVTRY